MEGANAGHYSLQRGRRLGARRPAEVRYSHPGAFGVEPNVPAALTQQSGGTLGVPQHGWYHGSVWPSSLYRGVGYLFFMDLFTAKK